MTTEFNLSEREIEIEEEDSCLCKTGLFCEEDVKEFIRLIKNLFCLTGDDECHCSRCHSIDTLAGDNLK